MASSSVTSKVLSLLAAFDAQHVELSLTELARRAEVSVPTAHRRAAELVEWGALERTGAGSYRIGLRLWEVGSLAPRAPGLREAALPFMEDLYVLTRQNVQLAVRDEDELVFVERIAGRKAVPVLTRVGGRFHLHATGVGQVLLAFAPADVQERVLAGDLPRYAKGTITDPARLRRVLAEIRKRGYAVSERAVTDDATSVAAPVRDGDGAVVAAVSIVVEADGARPREVAPYVLTAGRAISRALGASHSSSG
ncbi:IclR family transcriptional regulator [Aeromicrobium sp. CF3.5]|uniref:IclR family transcriptional regulator n=1 Tax=Aeromicrobium sp. CF3.5 TaxID=3373078 RepID=UPI003EE56A4E